MSIDTSFKSFGLWASNSSYVGGGRNPPSIGIHSPAMAADDPKMSGHITANGAAEKASVLPTPTFNASAGYREHDCNNTSSEGFHHTLILGDVLDEYFALLRVHMAMMEDEGRTAAMELSALTSRWQGWSAAEREQELASLMERSEVFICDNKN